MYSLRPSAQTSALSTSPTISTATWEHGRPSQSTTPRQRPTFFTILKNGHSPCKVACPANVNVQGYVQLIRKREYVKAINLIRERNPLPAICGRVCTHPCEDKCTRASVDSAVAIRLLKRFVSDKETEMIEAGMIALPNPRLPPEGAKRVAVIGAGPAGLTAAADLADRGFAVTIYEAGPAAGGMLRWGIPEYRLPKRILDHEIEFIRRKGIAFVYNCRVGQTLTLEALRRDNDAVFVGVGTQVSRKLAIEGENKPGVYYGPRVPAPDIYRRQPHGGQGARRGGGRRQRGRGCGPDRAAPRGRDVTMVCLEQRHEMPALHERSRGRPRGGHRHPERLGPGAHRGRRQSGGHRIQELHQRL
jgi:hypothetical protein